MGNISNGLAAEVSGLRRRVRSLSRLEQDSSEQLAGLVEERLNAIVDAIAELEDKIDRQAGKAE